MSRETALPSYPESTRSGSLRLDPGSREGEPPDGPRNPPGEAPLPLSSAGRAGAESTGPLGPAAAERPLSLLEKEEWSHGAGWSLRSDRCRFESLSAFDPNSGEFVPSFDPHCKSARCRHCSRAYLGRTFALARLALDHVDRARLVTFTLASDEDAESWSWEDWREARKVQRRFLRRRGFDWESLSVLEEGTLNGRPHMHDVQHGSFIPVEALTESWPYGRTNIQSRGGVAAASYLSKSALPYLAKNASDAASDEALEAHMRLNGGRAEHHTRKFFAGVSRASFARSLDPIPGAYLLRYLDSETGRDLSKSETAALRRAGGNFPRKVVLRAGS